MQSVRWYQTTPNPIQLLPYVGYAREAYEAIKIGFRTCRGIGGFLSAILFLWIAFLRTKEIAGDHPTQSQIVDGLMFASSYNTIPRQLRVLRQLLKPKPSTPRV